MVPPGSEPPPSISRMPDDADARDGCAATSRRSAPAVSPTSTISARGASTPTRSASTATAPCAELRAEFGDLPPGTETEVRVSVAGRILLLRRQGKLTFATVRDQSGAVQLFVSTRGARRGGARRLRRPRPRRLGRRRRAR